MAPTSRTTGPRRSSAWAWSTFRRAAGPSPSFRLRRRSGWPLTAAPTAGARGVGGGRGATAVPSGGGAPGRPPPAAHAGGNGHNGHNGHTPLPAELMEDLMLKLPASMLRSLQEKSAREGRPAQALVL